METLNATPAEAIVGTLIILIGAYLLTIAEEPMKTAFRTILQRIKAK